LVLTLEISQHLNHPVDHSRAQSWCYFMLLQAVISPEYRFKFSNIQINGLAILCLDIDVLSFDLSSLLSRKMGRWVWNRKLKRNDL